MPRSNHPVERAKIYLDEPLTDVEFSSASSGIRTFKRHTGLTMGQYRRRYQDGRASG